MENEGLLGVARLLLKESFTLISEAFHSVALYHLEKAFEDNDPALVLINDPRFFFDKFSEVFGDPEAASFVLETSLKTLCEVYKIDADAAEVVKAIRTGNSAKVMLFLSKLKRAVKRKGGL